MTAPCTVCGANPCPRPKPTLESLAAELDALRHQLALVNAGRKVPVWPYPMPAPWLPPYVGDGPPCGQPWWGIHGGGTYCRAAGSQS
jgi:hypothetical protein